MNAYVYPSQQEKVISGASALVMHLMFIALLVFGVNWQKKIEPQANIVDLWANLPSPAPPKVEPRPEPPPPEIKPVVPPKIEPPPPPKAAVKPEIAKPDIALKEKAEKEKAEKARRVVEEKQKEAKKREDDTKAAQKQQAKEAEAQRAAAKEEEDAKRKAAQQAAAARKNEIDKYKTAIHDKIKRFIVLPPNLQGNPEAEFDVTLLPDGNPLGVKLRRTSGNSSYDNAIERAILKAQPLPVPRDEK
ncbi:MAG TPA: energy transducer TonB, partial [Burkholderiales bacterium]|nr:energy transducer TonB [Burkholderiales bacterium]